MIEGSEVSAQDAEGEHDCERPEPNCYPEPRAEAVGGMHVLQDWLVWHLRALGHAFLLESQGSILDSIRVRHSLRVSKGSLRQPLFIQPRRQTVRRGV